MTPESSISVISLLRISFCSSVHFRGRTAIGRVVFRSMTWDRIEQVAGAQSCQRSRKSHNSRSSSGSTSGGVASLVAAIKRANACLSPSDKEASSAGRKTLGLTDETVTVLGVSDGAGLEVVGE